MIAITGAMAVIGVVMTSSAANIHCCKPSSMASIPFGDSDAGFRAAEFRLSFREPLHFIVNNDRPERSTRSIAANFCRRNSLGWDLKSLIRITM
jgi:hypothetical protein